MSPIQITDSSSPKPHDMGQKDTVVTQDTYSFLNPLPKNIVPTTNISSGRKQCPFTLPRTFPIGCQNNVCHGSLMEKPGSIVGGIDRPPSKIWEEANEYIREFYQEKNLPDSQRDIRLAEICRMIFEQGYYVHTYDELSFGVKTAWRNARRCVMRSQWNAIQAIDCRDVKTSEGMLDACINHLRIGHNGGRIRPTMTVFPQKLPGRTGPRVWSHQLTRYAGYRMQNGTIVGDPANVELTDVAITLGWTPKYGRWDILPIIVSAEGESPKWREVPSDCYKEVKITHPTLSWFEELDLRWTDHPPVSAFVISIGGIDYCAAPFSGWYLGTEVAARNLGDEHRYNALPDIGRRLGLPMNNRSLWKDRAVTELNIAVLHSFDKAKITIIDHHSASDSFVAHYEKEIKTRGHCPADWVWLTPPSSSSTTSIFHQEMYSYLCKPAVIPLEEKPWDMYFRETGIDYRPKKAQSSPSTPENSQGHIIIAYGTETGTAERYAKELQKYLRGRLVINITSIGLDDLDLSDFQGIICIVSSSFGEGEPPSNATQFRDRLTDALEKSNLGSSDFRYAVLGLGSTNYAETYQSFPRWIDRSLGKLKARRIIPLGELDDCDAASSENVFENWLKTLAIAIEVGTESTDVEPADNKPTFARVIKNLSAHQQVRLSRSKPIFSGLGRDTYHVELTTSDGTGFKYQEGDHISILPPTTSQQVELVENFMRVWGKHVIDNVSVSTILSEYADIEAAVKVYPILQTPDRVRAEELPELIRSIPLKVSRMFSLSSSPAYHPSTVHIAIARLEQGRVSIPLTSIVPEGQVPPTFSAAIRTSGFRMPDDLSVPIILIGCGTGVGPLRGMMHGRLAAFKTALPSVRKGEIMCFTGFRSPQEHCYLSEFVEEAEAQHISYYPAYSRFENRKEHVGDVMCRHSTNVSRALEQGAVILICGSHAVRGNVEEALLKIGRKEFKLSEEEAQGYLTQLKREGKFISSTYSRTL